MPLKNKRLSQFIKSPRMALLCGFIASMACVSNYAEDTVTNAVPAADAPAGLVIVNAVYGNLSNPAATTNVTKIVAAMVNDNALNFHIDNGVFGGDPAEGLPKELKVDYTIDGVADTKTASEGSRLRLSANPPASPKKSRLVIVKAVYGDLPYGQATDVTADLADMVENDGLELTVGDNTFGDPAWGKAKKLRVDYKFDGWKKSITLQEGKTLRISARIELAEIHKRILFFSLWIVSGILAVSAAVAAVALLARKWKK
jgi:hypothetical protein